MNKFLQLTVMYTILAGFSIQAEMHWNFPGYVDGWHSYTDASSGGNSESYKVKFSDSIIEWSFQLRNHNCNIWPFTGISRTVPFSERKEIEDSDSLIIVVVLTLILFIPGLITFIILKKNNKPDNSSFDSIQIKPRPVPGPPSEWERVLEYLQVNYTDPQLNLQQLAINIGISDSKHSRLINERCHDGFRYLVHEFRINEGKRLLKESEMNISEIAYKLGYATSNHFNREFKKRTLLSPSSFRKSVSKEKNDEIISEQDAI
jgi:AraC-like DNA-binding protein